jgi:adenylosuccinate lyase
VERYIGPDATVALDFSLRRLSGLIKNLVVYPDNMLRNLNQMRGLVFSQKILLDLTQAGVSREEAYRMVQRNAMKVWDEGKDFQEELLADAAVVEALGEDKIRESFDLNYHLKHVDTIFERVFKDQL